ERRLVGGEAFESDLGAAVIGVLLRRRGASAALTVREAYPHTESVTTTPRAEPIDRLRDDVRLLGELVGEVLREQGGRELFEDVEHVRQAAIELRQSDNADARELLEWAEQKSTRRLMQLV